jgi:hypothetical protein
VKFEARIRELVENLPDLAVLVEPMLIVRRVLRELRRPRARLPRKGICTRSRSSDFGAASAVTIIIS